MDGIQCTSCKGWASIKICESLNAWRQKEKKKERERGSNKEANTSAVIQLNDTYELINF